MAKKGSFSKVYDKNGDYADVEAVRFDGTRTVQMQGDVTASQTWNGDPSSPLTLNASIGAKKVTTDKINDKAVGTAQLADDAVGLTQIDDNAMTSAATSGDDRLITSGGVRNEIDNALLNRGVDYPPMTPAQINAITDTIPTGSTVHVTEAGTITDGDIVVRAGEDLRYYRGNGEHYWYSLDGDFKLKQQAKSSPTASGSTLEFIDSITQDENGEITASKKSVQDGTTSQKGVVQLEDSHSSTSTTKAATPKNVKEAYDLANTANTGAVKNVAYDSTNKKITKTINGTTTDVVSVATLKTDMDLNNVDNTSDANKPVSTAQQAALDLKLDKTGDGKDVTATFTEASSRENIGTGEKLSVMFSKIKKWFTDLGTAAFKNVPTSGNAGNDEVVLGSDTRLSAGANAVQDVTVDGASVVNSSTKVAAVPDASTSAKGAVQLAGSIGATVASENNKAATEKAVRDAINALDSNKTSTDGTNVQVKVTEADGKISVVNITTDNTENRNNKVSSWQTTPDDTHYPTEKLVKSSLDDKVDKVEGKGLSTEDYTTAEKTKLVGIAAGAEVNQNAFSNVLVGSATIAADSKTDTLEIAGGTGIDAVGDTANDKVTLSLNSATQASLGKADSAVQSVKINGGSELKDSSGNVNIPLAVATGSTGAKAGALSSDDKKKLNDLGTAAFKNVPASGDASSTEVVLGSDTRLSAGASAIQGVKVNNTTLTPDANKVVTVPLATTSADGAMSAADKTKLNSAATYTQSSGTAPVKVGGNGELTAVPVDSYPNQSHTDNLISSKAVYDALLADGSGYNQVRGPASNKATVLEFTIPNDSGRTILLGEVWTSSSMHYYIHLMVDDSTMELDLSRTYGTSASESLVVLYKLDTSTRKLTIAVNVGSYYTLISKKVISLRKNADSQNVTYSFVNAAADNTYSVATILKGAYSTDSNGDVGSASVPVYLDNGEIKACTDDFVHDGDVAQTYSSTSEAPISGKGVASAISGRMPLVEVDNSDTDNPLNANDFRTTGFYHFSSGVINTVINIPDVVAGHFVLEVLNHRGRVYQRFIAGEGQSEPGYVYSRVSKGTSSTSWQPWTKEIRGSDVTSTYSVTGTDPVNGTAVAAAIAANDLSHISLNRKWHSICVANTSSTTGWCKFATITKKNANYESYRIIGFFYRDSSSNYNSGVVRLVKFQAVVNFKDNGFAFYVSKSDINDNVRLVKIDDSTFQIQFYVYSNKSEAIYGVYDNVYNESQVVFETSLVAGGSVASSDVVTPSKLIEYEGAVYNADCDGSGNNIESTYVKKADGVTNVEYVANQSGGGGNLNKTINGTPTSVLAFMNDSEAVAIWADAKAAAANAS